ncbi:MAG: hypothetical protein KAJ55_03320 [Anaerolineales bacterium]|nr:hypothetical protein [Anaerolineales bacterium]
MSEATTVEGAVDLFGEVPEAPTKPKKTSKAKKDREVIPFKDFDVTCSLGLMIKAMESVFKQRMAQAKEYAVDTFVKKMVKHGIKPDSFTARGELGTALVSLAKRGSHLKVDPETAERLIEQGVHLDVIESVPERLIINPEILEDQEAIQAVAEAIKTHPKLKDKQVVMKQSAEKHYAVSEMTIPQLATKAQDEDAIRDVIGKLTIVKVGRFVLENCADGGEQKKKAMEILFGKGIL